MEAADIDHPDIRSLHPHHADGCCSALVVDRRGDGLVVVLIAK
jgi:hypothetical protein